MAKYDPKSLHAEEFIHDGEILDTLRYAEENKRNVELIDQILEKARPQKTETGYVCAGLTHREASVLLACEEDLTNDGLKDLVVIFATTEDDEHVGTENLGRHKHIRLTVAIDSGDGVNYEFTEPIPAPVENQKIQFQNIDKKDEIEFVLQGQKDNKVGYGIFRVVEGETVNLFGEGMEDC